MARSHEWTEYHLTPNGWMSGAERSDGSRAKTDLPRPADAVKTVRVTETYTDHLETYSSVEFLGDAAEIAELERRFGPAPEHV